MCQNFAKGILVLYANLQSRWAVPKRSVGSELRTIRTAEVVAPAPGSMPGSQVGTSLAPAGQPHPRFYAADTTQRVGCSDPLTLSTRRQGLDFTRKQISIDVQSSW